MTIPDEVPVVTDVAEQYLNPKQLLDYRSNIIGYDIRYGQSSYTPIWLAALTGGGVSFYSPPFEFADGLSS